MENVELSGLVSKEMLVNELAVDTINGASPDVFINKNTDKCKSRTITHK